MITYTIIHSFVLCIQLIFLGLSQLSLGERQGTPWTNRQSIAGPHRDKRDKQPYTDSNQENSNSNFLEIHSLFGHWPDDFPRCACTFIWFEISINTNWMKVHNMLLTFMMPWQVASGSPTRLVSLMDIIWSPTLSFPERAAGPLFSILASMTVGRMEPQPDSTITTPRISPFCFSTYSWNTDF